MNALEATPQTMSWHLPSRRGFLRTLASAGAFARLYFSAASLAETASVTNAADPAGNSHSAETADRGDQSIRPFHVDFPQAAILDLRRRIAETNWPEQETVPNTSQGVQLATMQALARYWQKDYDWRKVEARLNALPQFTTNIDGLEIHFIHVRSKNPHALPVIITHGWPGSIIEQMKVIGPLTDPTAYGGNADDSFDVVIPSLPGHGFSAKPPKTGWDPVRIARAWVMLMECLGYSRYVAQGGDWGNAVTEQMALLKPPGLLGIHTNMPAAVPDDIAQALGTGGPAPSGLSAEERHAYDQLDFFYKHGLGYAQEMNHRPQTLYGLGVSRSASLPGCSTTMQPARRSSHAFSMDIPKALRGTMCWKTSPSTG